MAKRNQGHDAVIQAANVKYSESKAVFVQAETLIDEAQQNLTTTMDNLRSEIDERQSKLDAAQLDFNRNAEFKEKLKSFTE